MRKTSILGAVVGAMLAAGGSSFFPALGLGTPISKTSKSVPRHRASKPVKAKRKAQRVARRQNRK